MFEKFEKEKEPEIENKLELLKELKINNSREILLSGINIRVAERSKIVNPNNLARIQQFIDNQRLRKKDLIMGLEVINDEIKEYEKENKKREGN